MAAKTIKRTAKLLVGRAQISFKPRKGSSRIALSLRNLRIKQRKAKKKSSALKLENEITSVWLKLWKLETDSTRQSDLGRSNQSRLSRLEFVCKQLIRLHGTESGKMGEEWTQLSVIAALKFPTLPEMLARGSQASRPASGSQSEV